MEIDKIISKKQIWKFFRWVLEKIYPKLFTVIQQAVNKAAALDGTGREKWLYVWNAVRDEFDDADDWAWFINLCIEVLVGFLIVNGKERLVWLIKETK